ncbi:sugar ABC transporter ATP-binding protein [Sphaerisporangium sp. NPDC088356]|uniref:sugar ABC transporter ATP-binding protein n=1 Tax=Sphaerisporangium sp. NPDC088356 TaxID=3154871 RepID=UPI0034314E96
MVASSTPQPLLRMEGITKSYGSVQVLHGVDLSVGRGEVLGLLGENGAGKSTLLNILNGVIPRDTGSIVIDGAPVEFTGPKQAQEAGLAFIHQELSVLPYLSVAENVFLNRLPRRKGAPWLVDWPACYRQAGEILERLSLKIDPRTLVGRLGTAEQELVEIAKALSMNARIITMDEPTASLTESEIERLFTLMRALKADGVSVLYVSHRLDEVGEICDRATILRDGKIVTTVDAKTTDSHALATMMVGRELSELFPKTEHERGRETLRVSNLSNAKLNDVSFTAHAGEILGLAGLVGSGRTELARAVFGADPIGSGEVFVNGEAVTVDSPGTAIRHGIGLVPEDRKHQGAVLPMTNAHNITLASLAKVSRWGQLDRGAERQAAKRLIQDLRVHPSRIEQETGRLSGGNQQKVVLAKWLFAGSDILIVDEPTRGVDVGARAAIHGLLDDLAGQGATIIMISSDLPEVMGMSDRILVMHEGRIAGELAREDFSEEAIVMYASGLRPAASSAPVSGRKPTKEGSKA